MRHYLTTAHAPLLPQLRALFRSMQRHCRPFTLHVLAEGREVFDWAIEQREIQPIAVEGFVKRHPDFAAEALPGARTSREVAITQRWAFLIELLGFGAGAITAIDTDVMFFSSPEPVFEEIGDARMAVLPHGFAPAALGQPGVTRESHLRYGEYNGGWVYFASIAPARAFAELCRQGPISEDGVCPDGVTRWGEQGKLEWLAGAHGAHVIQHPAACPGPWCANAQSFEARLDGAQLFGGRELVAWHFHSLRLGGQLADANYEVSPLMLEAIYGPYLDEIALQ